MLIREFPVKRIKMDNSFIEVKCQFKTHARSFAESDVRNLYSFAIMNEAFLSSIDGMIIFGESI